MDATSHDADGQGHGGVVLTWQYVGGNQAHSARRRFDHPAPTVHFAARMNLVTWQTAPDEG